MTGFQRRGRLWVPEAPMLNLIREVQLELASPAMGIAGVYGYEVGRDLAAGVVRESAEFGNMITDAGLDALGGTLIDTLTRYFAVGTGSAPPAVGDGGLQSQVGPRINTTGGFSEVTGYNTTTDPANPYWYRRIPRVWAKGVFGGDVNLTELGVFSAATGGVCWSRQLFRDGAGLPTTVTVLADEELKVWYEYRLYPPMMDVVQTMTIKGVSTTVTNRSGFVHSVAGWGTILTRLGQWTPGTNVPRCTAYPEQGLPSRTADPTGTGKDTRSGVFAPYIGNSLSRRMSHSFLPSEGNVTGGKIGVLGFNPDNTSTSTISTFRSHFSPAMVKTTEEYLNVEETFAWARTPNPTI